MGYSNKNIFLDKKILRFLYRFKLEPLAEIITFSKTPTSTQN